MKTFIDMCSNNSDSQASKSKKSSKVENMNVEHSYKLMDQQKCHMIFIKEIGDLTDDEKYGIISQIKKLNVIMEKTGLNSDKSSNNVSN